MKLGPLFQGSKIIIGNCQQYSSIKQSGWLNPVDILLEVFSFVVYINLFLLMYLFFESVGERGRGEGSILSRLCPEQGARYGARSYDHGSLPKSRVGYSTD